MSSTRGRASGSPAVPVIAIARGEWLNGRRPSCSARMCRSRGAWRPRRRAARPLEPPPSRCSPRLPISGASRCSASDVAEAFRRELARSGLARIVAHDSYLINLATPDPALRARSEESFRAELERCAALGIPSSCRIPGNFIDDRARGIARNAEAITRCLEAVPGAVGVLLETTAGHRDVARQHVRGAGRAARGRSEARCAHRIAFCADTCHLYSAGYDLRARLRRRLAAVGRHDRARRACAASTSTTRRRRSTPAATGTSSSPRARSAPSRSAASCATPASPAS